MPCSSPSQTETANSRSRRGRCYQLSYRLQQFDDRFRDWILVHGVALDGNGETISHAWLKREDAIYDAVFDAEMPAELATARYGLREQATYDREQAVLAAAAAGFHYAPWES
jgi:hypothetical protein